MPNKKSYWTPSTIVFNVIGNIVLLAGLFYTIRDWNSIINFDRACGIFIISLLIFAHIKIFFDWKKDVRS